MALKLVLVDDSVEGDLRVLQSIRELGRDVRVIDIRADDTGASASLTKIVLVVFSLVVRSLWLALPRSGRLCRILRWQKVGSYFGGVSACMKWLTCSVKAAYRMRNDADLSNTDLVLVNDLYCAVAGISAGFSPAVPFIYDSHELQIHRNRKKGPLRILIEYGLEQMVLCRSNELRVVNQAISDQMNEWYDMPSAVRIVYNNFYPNHAISFPAAVHRPVLIYVGKGLVGRKLEVINRPPEELGFDVNVFLLGAKLPPHISANYWTHGPVDYREALQKLASSRRCLMWCCLETSSLSYQLSTPNKFFQALAVGVPILASRGSYLAEVVKKYDIGAVFNGNNLGEIAEKISSPIFETWVMNVGTLRERLSNGSVII